MSGQSEKKMANIDFTEIPHWAKRWVQRHIHQGTLG